jgi:hypothetical protein
MTTAFSANVLEGVAYARKHSSDFVNIEFMLYPTTYGKDFMEGRLKTALGIPHSSHAKIAVKATR